MIYLKTALIVLGIAVVIHRPVFYPRCICGEKGDLKKFMACEICMEMKGDWTSRDKEFYETFNIIHSASTSMILGGLARCKTCGQKIDFEFDDTLIPKLRVRFLAE